MGCVIDVKGLDPIGASIAATTFSGDFDVVTAHFNFKINNLAIVIGREHIASVSVPPIGSRTVSPTIGVQGKKGNRSVLHLDDSFRGESIP